MFSKLIILAISLFILGAFGQVVEDKLVIDPFTTNTPTFLIQTPTSDNFDPITESRFTSASNIVGGERDIQLTALSGGDSIFSSSVNNDGWTVNTPIDANGFAFLQYDGPDESSNLNENGLDLNLLADNGRGFRIELSVDIDTIISIFVYSEGNQCEEDIEIEGDPGEAQEFFIDFDDFDGNCNFASVGALEFLVEAFDNVDIVLNTFVVYGDVPVILPSPSPESESTESTFSFSTITESTISLSTITVPTFSEPSIPTYSEPEPETPNECVCNCGSFRCGLVYAVPGDDDDNVDDDIHDDDDLIYRPVYYGPVDDDFNYILGDDDEHELISREGGLTISHNDDDDETRSASSSLVVSFTFAVIAIASLL